MKCCFPLVAVVGSVCWTSAVAAFCVASHVSVFSHSAVASLEHRLNAASSDAAPGTVLPDTGHIEEKATRGTFAVLTTNAAAE